MFRGIFILPLRKMETAATEDNFHSGNFYAFPKVQDSAHKNYEIFQELRLRAKSNPKSMAGKFVKDVMNYMNESRVPALKR